MSTVIDEKVVEMQFDNKNFEKNVGESLDTLGKLKEELKFDKVKDSFDNITKNAKKVDLSSIKNACEDVKVRFSALDVAFATVVSRITNMAMSAGKQIASAITIEPIKSGLQEYETYMGSIQTILSNTKAKGTTFEDVTDSLDELNRYADKTIYNFTQMTRNIGTFTAAGVGLKDSTAAIKGIANLAAISGSNAEQASHAMYNLSQALSLGSLRLMDWNSVVNAGMGGEVFQNELKETARHLRETTDDYNYNVDELIKKHGSFRASLQENWVDQRVLTETLAKFTGDLTDEQLKAMKYSDAEIERIKALGRDANDAATKVKSLSQLIDTLKEALQSGWTMSWRLIIGNFYQARDALTSISNIANDMIGKAADQRNEYLTRILGSDWDNLVYTLGGNEKGFMDVLKRTATQTSEETGSALDKIMGQYSTTEEAFQEAVRQNIFDVDELRHSILVYTAQVMGMSEEEREAAGITEDRYEQMKKLRREVLAGTFDFRKFIAGMRVDKQSARENIFSIVSESLKTIMSYVEPIRNALYDAFLPGRDAVLTFTKNLVKFIKRLRLTDAQGDKLKRTFDGLFSVLKLLLSIPKNIGKAFMNVFGAIFDFSADSVLDFTAHIGDLLVKFTDMVRESDVIRTVFEKVFTVIKNVIGAIVLFVQNVVDFVRESETIQRAIDIVRDFFKLVWGWAVDKWDKVISKLQEFWETMAGKDWKTEIESWLKKVADGFEKVVKVVFNFALNAKEKLREFGAAFKETPLFGYIEDMHEAFRDIGSDTIARISGIFTGINPSEQQSKNLSKFGDALMTAAGILTSLLIPSSVFIRSWIDDMCYGIEKLVGLLEEIAPRIGPLLLSIVVSIGDYLKANSDSIKTIIVSLVGIAVESLVESVPIIVDGTLRVIKAVFDALTGRVPDIIRSIRSFINAVLPDIRDMVIAGLKVGLVVGVIRALKTVDNVIDTIKDILPHAEKGFGLSERFKFESVIGAITAIVLSLAALMGVVYLLARQANKDPKSLTQALQVVITIVTILGIVLAGISAIAKKAPSGEVKSIAALAGVMALLSLSITNLAKMVGILSLLNPGKLWSATGVIMALSMIVSGMFAVVAVMAKGKSSTSSKKMLAYAGIVAILTLLLQKLARTVAVLALFPNQNRVWSATLVIAALSAVVTGMMFAFIGAMKVSKGMRRAAVGNVIAMVAVMTKAVQTLAITVGALAMLDQRKVWSATGVVTALGLLVAGLAFAFELMAKKMPSKDLVGMNVMIGMLSGLVVSLGAVTYALAQLDVGQALTGVLSLAGALAVVVGFVYSLQALAKSNYAEKVILLLAGIGASLIGLGVAAAGFGIGFLTVSVGLQKLAEITDSQAVQITNNLKTLAKGFIDLIPDIALALGEASATILIGLGKYAVPIAQAVNKILLAILDETNKSLPQFIRGISLLLINSTVLLTAYTPLIVDKLFDFLHAVLRKLIERVPELIKDIVDLLAAIFKGFSDAMKAVDPKVWEEGFYSITVIGAIVGYLASIGPLIPLAMTNALAMEVLILELAGLVELTGAIAGGRGSLDALEKGGKVLKGLGEAIGGFVGGIVGSFGQAVTDSLPAIGQNLSSFATNVEPFINTMSSIDPSAMAGAETLSGVIMTLAGAGFIENASKVATGIAGFFTGGLSSLFGGNNGTVLDNFNSICSTLGEGLSSFQDKIKDIKDDTFVKASLATKRLAEAYSELPVFARTESMGDLTEQLGTMGAALADFTSKMGDVSVDDAREAAEAAYEISLFLNKMTPFQETYGFISSIAEGHNGEFQEGLHTLSVAFAQFGEDARDIKPGLVTRGVEAITSILEVLDEVWRLRDGIYGMYGLKDGLKSFADEDGGLAALAKGVKAFGIESGKLNPDNVQKGADAAKLIIPVLSGMSEYKDFIQSFSSGGDGYIADPDAFSKCLGGLASGMVEFSKKSEGMADDIGTRARKVSAALKHLSSDDITLDKGLLKTVLKEDSSKFDKFGANLTKIGSALYGFSSATALLDTKQVTAAAKAAAEVAKAVAEFPEDIMFSSETISSIFNTLGDVGTGLTAFSDNSQSVASAHVVNVAKAAAEVVTVLQGLKDSGDASNIKKRAGALAEFGTQFAAYYSATAGINTERMALVTQALIDLVNAVKSAGLVDPEAAGNIVSALAGIGGLSVDSLVNEFSGGGAKQRVRQAISSLISDAVTSAQAAADDLVKAMTDMVNAAVNSISDGSIYPGKFEEVGCKYIEKLTSAFTNSKNTVDSAISSLFTGLASKLDSYSGQFQKSGYYLVAGFANGIRGNGSLAYTAAYSVGAQAVRGLRAATKEKSPSRVAHEAGDFFGVGFINGISNTFDDSYTAAYQMGTRAVDGMNHAIANIRDSVDAQLDTQPVIKPVLDLSNVQSRSRMLTSILSRDQAMVIGSSLNEEKGIEIQNSLKVPEPGDNYSFVQNNYSPKALSRIEIYRQTKNQFSAMKGLATES